MSARHSRAKRCALILVAVIATPALAQTPAVGSAKGDGSSSEAQRPFDTYAAYALRVDEIARGPDRNWQALVTIRNLQPGRANLSAGHLVLRLRNASGEELRSWGELYRASVTGPINKLDKLVDTVVINAGETTQVRLAFFNSAKFTPVGFRMENVMESGFRDHALAEASARVSEAAKPTRR